MGRIQGLSEVYLTGDTLLKSGPGYLFSITIAWSGGTAGNKIIIRDGTDGTGTPAIPFVIGAENGTFSREWFNGKAFENGIYVDFQGSGYIEAEVTFK